MLESSVEAIEFRLFAYFKAFSSVPIKLSYPTFLYINTFPSR